MDTSTRWKPGPEAWVHPDITYAWRGPSLLILDTHGNVSGSGLTGFYFRGARHLRALTFGINGETPHLCSMSHSGTNRVEIAFVYPEVSSGGTGGTGSGMLHRQHGILERGLDLRLSYVVRPAGIDIDLVVVNRWDAMVEFDVGWEVDADFVSLEDVRNGGGLFETQVERRSEDDGMCFRPTRPDLPLATDVRGTGSCEWTEDKRCLHGRVRVARGEYATVGLRVRARDAAEPIDEQGMLRRERRLEDWESGLCGVLTPEQGPVATAINRALRDIGGAALLDGPDDGWLAPAAGYPHYGCLFGRDALTSGWMASMFDRGESVEHTLTRLSRLQGSRDDPARDEEPGRMVQQCRSDPAARLGLTPFDRYYGDFAAPLMFVVSLAHLYSWSGDRRHLRRHWDACRRVLDWAERYGDRDGDGFLEYRTRSQYGPRNQGWKDSENAVVYEDGTLVEPPIASCEVQGYYYAALQVASVFATLLGAPRDALEYAARARRLKQAFNRAFWVDDGGYVAFGLDSRKRPIRSRTSNMGHCLASGVIDRARIGAVAQTLFAPDMYSGWGVRTLSSSHPAYNPLSYHLGSVWSVENATIAFGLRRYGLDREAMTLSRAVFDLASLWRGSRVPECVGGYDRTDYEHPGAFPRATAPQTWNSAALCLLTHVILGLQPVAPLRTLFVDPMLPEWLPDLTLDKLRLGGASAGLRFRRDRDGLTHIEVLYRRGTMHILRQPPINSLFTSPWRRATSLIASLWRT